MMVSVWILAGLVIAVSLRSAKAWVPDAAHLGGPRIQPLQHQCDRSSRRLLVMNSKAERSSNRPPSSPPTGFSYVEGENYDNEFEEVEAMGGDPFFLQVEQEDEEKETDPDFEWDGIVDDEAHLDFD